MHCDSFVAPVVDDRASAPHDLLVSDAGEWRDGATVVRRFGRVDATVPLDRGGSG